MLKFKFSNCGTWKNRNIWCKLFCEKLEKDANKRELNGPNPAALLTVIFLAKCFQQLELWLVPCNFHGFSVFTEQHENDIQSCSCKLLMESTQVGNCIAKNSWRFVPHLHSQFCETKGEMEFMYFDEMQWDAHLNTSYILWHKIKVDQAKSPYLHYFWKHNYLPSTIMLWWGWVEVDRDLRRKLPYFKPANPILTENIFKNDFVVQLIQSRKDVFANFLSFSKARGRMYST